MASKVKQLIAADEFLETDGALALEYLDIFAPKDDEEGEEDGEEGEEEDDGEDEMEDDEEGDEED